MTLDNLFSFYLIITIQQSSSKIVSLIPKLRENGSKHTSEVHPIPRVFWHSLLCSRNFRRTEEG